MSTFVAYSKSYLVLDLFNTIMKEINFSGYVYSKDSCDYIVLLVFVGRASLIDPVLNLRSRDHTCAFASASSRKLCET